MGTRRKPLTAKEHLEAVLAMCEREASHSQAKARFCRSAGDEGTATSFAWEMDAFGMVARSLRRRLAALKRARKVVRA